ncbi:N-acetylmuramoyl-L-alanine amidase [Nocardioides lijunqiniae]|uniref:N-acetylmuramoyl-L-alanine amidase family protein n=1 Tax=Nocardioides lijunqiniae TaxID=2760832 RepID=UPI0030B86795
MIRRTAAAAVTALLMSLVPAGPASSATPVERPSRQALPLAGRLVVVDPGHQLGNSRFPGRINRLVPAGGTRKPCNTTGTATRGGYPEATFNWRVALRLRTRLEALGATVVMTRDSNRRDRWGPCVDARGRAGNRARADLKISIHGDGSYARGARGFHVIAPTDRRPWTHDIYRPSRRLAVDTRAALRRSGFRVAGYIAGGDGLDFRADLATLNLSDVPTVMVELGNMRDRRDARRMTSSRGQARYARALTAAVRAHLAR